MPSPLQIIYQAAIHNLEGRLEDFGEDSDLTDDEVEAGIRELEDALELARELLAEWWTRNPSSLGQLNESGLLEYDQQFTVKLDSYDEPQTTTLRELVEGLGLPDETKVSVVKL